MGKKIYFTNEDRKKARIESAKRWNERNPEKLRLIRQNYRKKNKEKRAEYKRHNPEQTKASAKKYREKNKDKIKIINAKWREKNKDRIKLRNKQYIKKNKDKIRLRGKEWTKNNKYKIKKYREENKSKINEYFRKKYKEDISYKLALILRKSLTQKLRAKKVYKKNKALDLLGISIPLFKEHLKRKFKKGMSWENYGKWHIDHIVPVAKFDMNKLIDQKKCFHYTNLQPLWAEDNFRKNRY